MFGILILQEFRASPSVGHVLLWKNLKKYLVKSQVFFDEKFLCSLIKDSTPLWNAQSDLKFLMLSFFPRFTHIFGGQFLKPELIKSKSWKTRIFALGVWPWYLNLVQVTKIQRLFSISMKQLYKWFRFPF